VRGSSANRRKSDVAERDCGGKRPLRGKRGKPPGGGGTVVGSNGFYCEIQKKTTRKKHFDTTTKKPTVGANDE
jgi:hypothetical protein